ncbi:photosystem II protein PsbQ [Leptolyngbya sp. PCC 6406]|uniref:photosystem II protein PsbQ n=1 Tax=Leptolyngbya sp. PCC 6406 TaxID=1173264 RepID=UPI0002AC9ACD|nr:photosystem II protein PsbQ [Leptolyngbya sp. PCC 6406]
MIVRYRPILGLLLAVIATVLVSCGGPSVTQVPTYTPDTIAQIQSFNAGVITLRDRFPELEDYIQNKDWVNIRSFIHGPLGELRARLGRVTARLLPQDASQAKTLAESLAVHLERLDAAAAEYNQVVAGTQYRLALDDFDAFLQLVPSPTGEA